MKSKTFAAFCLALTTALPAAAQSYDRVVQAEVLPGWRMENGHHMAALRITLNPGWKTYWRAPGDAGIPPRFDWAGSSNLEDLQITWPVPKVFDQNGMRSIGYEQELILPVEIEPRRNGKDVKFRATLDIGVCRDICVPQQIKVSARLPEDTSKRDPRIAAALAERPLSEKEGRVSKATCRLSPTQDGLRIEARIQMPSAGGAEIAVIETDNPEVWVAEANTSRQGNTLLASTEMMHVNGQPFMIDRSGIRFTILGSKQAVDIQGCTSG
ncbi:protein-disulfide reductase DsbD family protein [Shimia thalassica]|uniref:protein-disulfide reductase DsbD domain-containing protein n=1 Tax=Shimia thalassica TaxID=1715693 RepID=UPI002494A98C|nr:protein-disulfide reductase DsbD domain-containing protein [Shimia thalassica]MDP2579214.1 protein-disulfide reductase DsbD family protein [Shimia thalassica]